MTVQLAPPLVFQAITPSGAPLAGGKLSTFAAGTSNPQATWVDATETTQNTNPVILNSMGQANLWLDQALTYKFLLSDPAGNPLYSTDGVSVGVKVFPPSQAEIAAGVVGSINTQYLWGDVRRYGAVLDGGTDCVAAMVIAAQVGGWLTVPGNMALASASLAALTNQAIMLKSGTTISSSAGFTTTITGTTPCNVFWSVNASSIEFYNFFVIGNGANSATASLTTGYFWYIQCTAAASAQMGSMCFDRGGLANFAGLYWIYVDNTASTGFAFVRFRALNNQFVSQPGNCNPQGLTQITVTAAVFGFSGSNSLTGAYTVKDVTLLNNFADGTYIKEFCFFWSGNLRCKASNNTLVGFGTDSSISNDTACYALTAYDFSHGAALAPNEIEFCDNLIDGVRDNGIYVATALMMTISGNRIQSQTGSGGTIPKGGISYTSGGYALISNNHVLSCQQGITISQPPVANSRVDLYDNAIHSVPNSGIGLLLQGTNAGNAQDINVDGLRIDSTGTTNNGVVLSFTAAVGCNDLNIENFDIVGTSNGIILFSPSSDVPAMGNCRIGRGRFRKISGNNLQWLNATNATTRATFESIDFMDLITGAVVFYIVNAVNVTVRALTFYDLTSGATFCWYGGGATGRVQGVQFVNVANSTRYSGAAAELGVITPTVAGNANDYVQDLNAHELGTAGSKYTRQGWSWDATAVAWKEVRALTGN